LGKKFEPIGGGDYPHPLGIRHWLRGHVKTLDIES